MHAHAETRRKRAAILLLAVLLLAGLPAACARPGSESGSGDALARPSMAESAAEEPFPVEDEGGPESAQEPEPAPPRANLERMMETIDALCGEPRPLGSEAEYSAALFLRERLEEYGYRARLEPFAYNVTASSLSERYRQARELTGEAFLAAALPGAYADGESHNLVGSLPGEAERERVLILSAHYDSAPDSIGVLDNAAGVAVVLEAARLLAGEELPFSLRVVLFGGEEEILIGSRHYLLGLEPDERGRIAGNITVDTLAYSAEAGFVVLTPLALPQPDAETLAAASPVAAALLADERVTPAFGSQLVGDHMSFAAAGIDSVNFGQSMDAVIDIINSPADTYEQLVPEVLPAAAELLADAVRELAAQMDGE